LAAAEKLKSQMVNFQKMQQKTLEQAERRQQLGVEIQAVLDKVRGK